jgi:hypothetical protein
MVVDTVDSLLNNAVDLYVQAVDYRRIPTSQTPTPVGVESDKLCWNPATFGNCRRIPAIQCQISARAARSPAIWSGYWPEPRPSGREPGRIRQFCAGFRQRSQESGTNGLIPGTFAGNCMKNNFYIILY